MKFKSFIYMIAMMPTALTLAMDDQTQSQDGCFPDCVNVLTPASPPICSCVEPFFTADYIYWTARENGLGYATSSPVGTVANPRPSGKGRLYAPHWQGKSGFKVGAGLNMLYDRWDVYLNYTWLRNNGNKSHAHASSGQELYNRFSLGAADLVFTDLSSASAKWNLHFNVLDLSLGRNYYVSKHLTLRPHFGLKGTWQKQVYDLKYNRDVAATNFTADIKQHMWGIGIRGGFNTTWYVCSGFSLIGDLDISGVWSRFNTKREDLSFSATTPDGLLLLNEKYVLHTLKPVIEWDLGIKWETCFCDDSYRFGILLAWEEQIWINQNEILNNRGDETRQGDLVLQGLTLGARFDF